MINKGGKGWAGPPSSLEYWKGNLLLSHRTPRHMLNQGQLRIHGYQSKALLRNGDLFITPLREDRAVQLLRS